MYQSLNKFGPIVSLLTIATVPLLAWKKNLNNYQQIRERIGKPSVDFQLPSICLNTQGTGQAILGLTT